MKLFRIGVLILVIGISMLVATHARARAGGLTHYSGLFGVIGPVVLEPKETTVVLRDLNPQNAKMYVVNALSWRPPKNITSLTSQDISKIQPFFTVTGLFKGDVVSFRIQWRGVYYIVIATNANEPVNVASVALEQKGIPQDLLQISYTLIGIGTILIAIRPLKALIKRRT